MSQEPAARQALAKKRRERKRERAIGLCFTRELNKDGAILERERKRGFAARESAQANIISNALGVRVRHKTDRVVCVRV